MINVRGQDHVTRYQVLRARYSVSLPGLINSDTPFTDLAAADLGRIRISCWLEPENLSWGRHKGRPAAIIPVQIKAERPPGCKLTDFSLDLQLLPARQSICVLDTSQHGCSPGDTGSKSFPYLATIPSPGKVCGNNSIASEQTRATGHPTTASRDVEERITHQSENWTFRSGCIADHMGRPVTARWTYEASLFSPSTRDHSPFHGAMVIFHAEQEFEVKCCVTGNSTRSRIRLRFGGQTCQPRFWRVKPLAYGVDLKIMIENLETRMVELNLPHTIKETNDAVSVEGLSARLNAMLVSHANNEPQIVRSGHNFGPSNIGGSGTVIMGDVSINYRWHITHCYKETTMGLDTMKCS